jgi:hypothetical protein
MIYYMQAMVSYFAVTAFVGALGGVFLMVFAWKREVDRIACVESRQGLRINQRLSAGHV